MEKINKNKISSMEDNYQINNDEFNKVEWINYFNEGLIVESINNQINNSLNDNYKIQKNTYDKNNNKNNINTKIIQISNNNSNIKNKGIIIHEKESIINNELYEKKNYYFSNIKELYGPKKLISFDYQEKITIDNFRNKSNKSNLFKDKNDDDNLGNKINENDNDDKDFKNKNFKNVKIIDDQPEKGNLRGKKILDNKNKRNKSADLNDDDNNNNRRKDNDDKYNNKNNNGKKNNNINNNIIISDDNNLDKNNQNKNKNKINLRNKNKFNFRGYDKSSYALRHKMEKDYKNNEHFHPNEEKPEIVNQNILLGRTLPEMIVLNNYGLVSDEDYEFYKNIIKLNNEKNIKTKII